jgi:hypothetical protein
MKANLSAATHRQVIRSSGYEQKIQTKEEIKNGK